MEFYCPATTKERVFGFDGFLYLVDENGRDKRLPIPSIHPFDDIQMTWPKQELYFVEMGGIRHVVIASTMREACGAIEKVNGWE